MWRFSVRMRKQDREILTFVVVVVAIAMVWWLFQQWWFWLMVGLLVALFIYLRVKK